MRISVERGAPQSERKKVIDGLVSFNDTHAKLRRAPSISVFLRDEEGEVRGGLLAEVLWEWLHVNSLWVDEPYRRSGYGSKLLEAAEAEGVREGCHSVHLDTFGFQARPFYEKQGYNVFGALEDYPKGFTRYYLYKRLIPDLPG